MSIITAQMKQFFRENGYVLIKNEVPKENCRKTVASVWEFMGKDPENAEDWYTPPEGMNELWDDQARGMIPLYHHQTLWDNRQHPQIYEAFAELNVKPPKREDKPELNSSFIQWDTDTTNLTFPLPLDPREWELANEAEMVDLTPLGRKLLGLDAW